VTLRFKRACFAMNPIGRLGGSRLGGEKRRAERRGKKAEEEKPGLQVSKAECPRILASTTLWA